MLCKDGTSFSQLAHLKTHMRTIHHQAKPYMCEGCNQFFKIKLELQFHAEECEKLLKLNGGEISKKYGSGGKYDESTIENSTSVSKMRLLIAVVLKKISSPDRLKELGFEKRLIDNVIVSALKMADRKVCDDKNLTEFGRLQRNVEEFLHWTIPETFMNTFKKKKRSICNILEDIAAAYSKNE